MFPLNVVIAAREDAAKHCEEYGQTSEATRIRSGTADMLPEVVFRCHGIMAERRRIFAILTNDVCIGGS